MLKYLVILTLAIAMVSSAPKNRDEDYYEDDEDEINVVAVDQNKGSAKINAKRNAPEENTPVRPRRQQQMSGRAQFYNLLMDILATLQSSTKNDIRQARKRELVRGSVHHG